MKPTGDHRKRVLFLCTGNSCRSQMAEGFLRHLAGERFESLSAGTRPVPLNPLAVKAMAEVGIDISRQRSKGPETFAAPRMDVVITVCARANDNCPVYPAATERLHWEIDDPAETTGIEEERMSVFRSVRDEICHRIRAFLEAADNAPEPPARIGRPLRSRSA